MVSVFINTGTIMKAISKVNNILPMMLSKSSSPYLWRPISFKLIIKAIIIIVAVWYAEYFSYHLHMMLYISSVKSFGSSSPVIFTSELDSYVFLFLSTDHFHNEGTKKPDKEINKIVTTAYSPFSEYIVFVINMYQEKQAISNNVKLMDFLIIELPGPL